MKNLENLFHWMANKNRYEILNLLFTTNINAKFTEITRLLDFEPSLISYHLEVLMDHKLIEAISDKGIWYYSITKLGTDCMREYIKSLGKEE